MTDTKIGNRLDKVGASNGHQTAASEEAAGGFDPYQWAMNRHTDGIEEFRKGLIGRDELFEVFMVGLACEGHVILEGMWGSGKTEGAKAFGVIAGMAFKRIQFTPDLMPQEITGSHMPDADGKFHFVPGPIFANLVLADEINRATPKTLSGMMEGQGEGQVTSNGETKLLPEPFFVISTQNPHEYEGTYPVPEALMDRQLMKYSMPRLRGEGQLKSIVLRSVGDKPTLSQVFEESDVKELMRLRRKVAVSEKLAQFIEDIVYSFDLKKDELVYEPAERAAIALAHVAQAVALFDGRAEATHHDVRKHAVSVLQHRLRLEPQREFDGMTPDKFVEIKLSQITNPNGS